MSPLHPAAGRFHDKDLVAISGPAVERHTDSVASDDASTDAKIHAALAQARDEEWKALWNAVDALAEETTFATWRGGDVIETSPIGDDGQAVWQMPYPVYSRSVEELRACIGRLGLVVPFDWMNWEGLRRYTEDSAALLSAPVADAVRMLTSILRSERFSDGSIEGALESGLLQTAVARLRRWYEEERWLAY